MKWASLFCIIASLQTPFAAWADSHKPTLLITSFEPFMGASVNRSSKVSHALAKILANQFEVHECLAPVIYDQGFEVAKKCLLELPKKPDLIISLGEGSPCDQVNLETLAKNIDNSWATDNAGQTRTQNTIIKNEPAAKSFKFFNSQIQDILISVPEIKRSIKRSKDMGDFVCNNLAFHMTTYLENYTAPRIPYTFMHVPSHQCGLEGMGVKATATAIARFLNRINLKGN